jgi:protein-tyrosine-phosphatase
MGLMEFPSFDEAIRGRLASALKRLEGEFEGIHDRETIKATLDASAQQLDRGSVKAFLPVLAERFARERLLAQAQTEGHLAKTKPDVLFVSLTGGGRAQIGAALLAKQAGDAVNVHSAGSSADAAVDPKVREALEEVGVDLSEAFTKPVTPEVIADADVVITMGRSVGKVEIPSTVRHVDWRVGNPAGADLDEARRVRDDIERRIEAFVRDVLPELTSAPVT